MNELLPSPNITALDEREQIQQMKSYMFQLKETLEFILTNIGTENLSVTLQKRLGELGVSIDETKTDADERQQATINYVHNSQLSVLDVINSKLFALEMENQKEYTDEKIIDLKKFVSEQTKGTIKLVIETQEKCQEYAKKYADEQIKKYHPDEEEDSESTEGSIDTEGSETEEGGTA